MKMKLVRDDDRKGKENFGKKGTELAGPEVWRFAFPCKGCLARPIDNEANNRIEQEFRIVDPTTRARLVASMREAGTLPVTVDPPAVERTEQATVITTDELEKLAEPKSDPKKK